ncbi:MAG: pyrroline-5-carboxylate reductase [Synechococcales bacterium]|nr:pyrroline-5-carboxylate reductase [Synechococcales bacterium]
MNVKLGIIGGGVMGEALLSRLLDRQIYDAAAVWVSDPQPSRRDALAQQYGVQTTADNRAVFAAVQVLLLAVKPQIFEAVVADLGISLPQTNGRSEGSDRLIISILAGTPLSRLEAAFPHHPVIRAMPNTPATVGAGVTAIAPGQYATAEHLAIAQQLFQSVGEVVQVPESQMDAVTGLSGSGPGYMAVIIEALIDGGVAAGLPRAIATQLALQTVRGTAELLQTKGLHPAALKDQVTSPGGTTIAGIARLEQAGVRSALIEAVRAAYRRSQELGQ